MDLLLGALICALLLWLTLAIWRHAGTRARAARIDPTLPAPPRPVETVRQRILEFCAAHPAIELHVEDDDLLITWRLLAPDLPSGAAHPRPESTQCLHLRMEPPHTVNVRYARGAVDWSEWEAASGRHPNVDWVWDMLPEFGRRRAPGEPLPEPQADSPHTIHGLEIPLRRIVLDAGWSWQPVLDLPPGRPVAPASAGRARHA